MATEKVLVPKDRYARLLQIAEEYASMKKDWEVKKPEYKNPEEPESQQESERVNEQEAEQQPYEEPKKLQGTLKDLILPPGKLAKKTKKKTKRLEKPKWISW